MKPCPINLLGKLLLLGLSCAALAGCALGRPNWCHPGPTSFQQQRAVLFDPYGDPDLGPEVVGGRPREYQKGKPEPARAQSYQESRMFRTGMYSGTWWNTRY